MLDELDAELGEELEVERTQNLEQNELGTELKFELQRTTTNNIYKLKLVQLNALLLLEEPLLRNLSYP